jgi:hypothetical protein
LLARTGAVTLDTNTVSIQPCLLGPVPTLPEWGFLVLATALLALGYVRLRRRAIGTAPSR